MKTTTTYNGWKNRETWNISLWLNGDERLYNLMTYFLATHFGRKHSVRGLYRDFIRYSGLSHDKTPDGVPFRSHALSYAELNAMLTENREEA